MELALPAITFKQSKITEQSKAAEIRRETLVADVHECLELMRINEMLFNLESDEDMLDAHIYEREALLCKYRSLMRQLKHVR